MAVAGLVVALQTPSARTGLLGTAKAQTTDAALAETLFQEGKRLMDAGKLDEACPKLAESHKLDPAGGTVLAAAMCFEKAGRVASAWAAFTDALAIANRDRRTDRAKFATEQLGGLELRLPRVAVDIPLPVRTLPGVALAIDGRPLPAAAWDGKTPVDPGTHTLSVRADGHENAELAFTMALGELKTVLAPMPKARATAPGIPVPSPPPSASAAAAPPRPSPPIAAPPETTRTHPTFVPGLVVGGVGLVALAVGAGFGTSAISKAKDANDRCPRARCADKAAVDLNDAAGTHATLATVMIPAGAVAAALGVFLSVRTAPAQTTASRWQLLRIAPSVSRDAASFELGGVF